MADAPPRREGRRKSKFERAADGSMTLMEHLADLRQRLMIAVLVILVGTAASLLLSKNVILFLADPYCASQHAVQETGDGLVGCNFNLQSPISHVSLYLKISLYMALVGTAPIWLYQLWAFIAPGLHRNERKYAYFFIGVAAPLFLGGAILAYFVVSHGMQFIMLLSGIGEDGFNINLDLEAYINFYIAVMMVFGIGFEFPLIMLMLNVMGLVTAKRMRGWWRIVVLVSFTFTAIFTPTPDPFGMTALAICMLLLYGVALIVATLNDKRKGITDEDQWDDEEASDISASDDDLTADATIGASSLDDDDYPGEPERRGRFGRRVDGYDDIT
ncbi:twin-arginine translocase subunit TatC [Glycomyces tritici]|uniref:Sec-independent protein translocase protein TatC n=1 Tax=Glycomyces tritici TaxID=2665176 RepID=A0ABT7YY49_9ACTN|nr:twin-arginine translocase subunit TatC [Glycomyces tritici]MDN3243576.1 twin-arginine translocase subunit TatC [Glycomyces tritici]